MSLQFSFLNRTSEVEKPQTEPWIAEYEKLFLELHNSDNNIRMKAEKNVNNLKQDESFIEKCWQVLFYSAESETHFVAATLLRQVCVYHWLKKQTDCEKLEKRKIIAITEEEKKKIEDELACATQQLRVFEEKIYNLIANLSNYLLKIEESIIMNEVNNMKEAQSSASQSSLFKFSCGSSSLFSSVSQNKADSATDAGGGRTIKRFSFSSVLLPSYSDPISHSQRKVFRRQFLHIICYLLKRGLIVNYSFFSRFLYTLLSEISRTMTNSYGKYLDINNISSIAANVQQSSNHNTILTLKSRDEYYTNIKPLHKAFLESSIESFSCLFSLKVLSELSEEINNSKINALKVQWADYIHLKKTYEKDIFIYLFVYSVNFLSCVLKFEDVLLKNSVTALPSNNTSMFFSFSSKVNETSTAIDGSATSVSSSSIFINLMIAAQIKLCIKVIENFVEFDFSDYRTPVYRAIVDYVSPSAIWLHIFFPILAFKCKPGGEQQAGIFMTATTTSGGGGTGGSCGNEIDHINNNSLIIIDGGGIPALWGVGEETQEKEEAGEEGRRRGGITSVLYILFSFYKALNKRAFASEMLQNQFMSNQIQYTLKEEEECCIKKLRYVITRLARIRITKMFGFFFKDLKDNNRNNFIINELWMKKTEEEQKTNVALLYSGEEFNFKDEVLLNNYIITNFVLSSLFRIYADLLIDSNYYKLCSKNEGYSDSNSNISVDEDFALLEFHDISYAIYELSKSPDICRDLYKCLSDTHLKIFLKIIDCVCLRIVCCKSMDEEKEFECMKNLIDSISLCAKHIYVIKIDLCRKLKQNIILKNNNSNYDMLSLFNNNESIHSWILHYEEAMFNIYELIITKYFYNLCNNENLLLLNKKYLNAIDMNNNNNANFALSNNTNLVKFFTNENELNNSSMFNNRWENMYAELHTFVCQIAALATVKPTHSVYIFLDLLKNTLDANEQKKLRKENNIEEERKINFLILFFSYFITENSNENSGNIFLDLRVPRFVIENSELQALISESLSFIIAYIKNESEYVHQNKNEILKLHGDFFIENIWLIFIGKLISAYLLKKDLSSINCLTQITSSETGCQLLDSLITLLCNILSRNSNSYIISYAVIYLFKLLCDPNMPTVAYTWECCTYKQLLQYSIDVRNNFFLEEYFVKNLNIKNIKNLFYCFSLSTNESEYIRSLAKEHINQQHESTSLHRSGTIISKELAFNRITAFLNACNYIRDDLQCLAQKDDLNMEEIKKVVIEINMLCGIMKGVISNKTNLLSWLEESKIYDVLLVINEKQNINMFTVLHSLRFTKNIIDIGIHEMDHIKAEKLLCFTNAVIRIFCQIYTEKVVYADSQEDTFRGVKIILKILLKVIRKQRLIKSSPENAPFLVLTVLSSINSINSNCSFFNQPKLSRLYIETIQIFIEENPEIVLTNMTAENYKMINNLLRIYILSGDVSLRHPAYECLHSMAIDFSNKIEQIFSEEENRLKNECKNSQDDFRLERFFFQNENIFFLNNFNQNNKFAVLLNELATTGIDILLHIVFEEPSQESLTWFFDLLFDILILLSFRPSFIHSFFIQFTTIFSQRVMFIEEESLSSKCLIIMEKFIQMRSELYADKAASKSLKAIRYTQKKQSFHPIFEAFIFEFLQQ